MEADVKTVATHGAGDAAGAGPSCRTAGGSGRRRQLCMDRFQELASPTTGRRSRRSWTASSRQRATWSSTRIRRSSARAGTAGIIYPRATRKHTETSGRRSGSDWRREELPRYECAT
eukprot:6469939-Pyramimonas_sp.AAC.1